MSSSFEIVHAADDAFGYIGHLTRSGDLLFAAGGTHAKPTILASSDGRAWSAKKPPPVNGLRDLLPVGADRLVTCGEAGALFVSDDRGETWSKRETDTTVCLFTLALDARGHVWLGGEQSFVRRSKDKGETFGKVLIGTDSRVNAIVPIESAVYFACHDGTLFRYKRDRIEKAKIKSSAPLTSFERTKAGTYVMTGDRATLLRSEDGMAWTQIDSPVKGVDLECVREIEPGVLVAVGSKGTVLVSKDEAKSFEPVPCPHDAHLWCVFPVPSGALVGADRGQILRLEIGAEL